MEKKNSEITCWIRFFLNRIIEFFVLMLWVLMAWSLDTYIIRPFPINDLAKYCLVALEIIFNLFTFIEIIKILFFSKKTSKQYPPWWV